MLQSEEIAKVAGSDGLLYETPLPAGEVTVADIFKTKELCYRMCRQMGNGRTGYGRYAR